MSVTLRGAESRGGDSARTENDLKIMTLHLLLSALISLQAQCGVKQPEQNLVILTVSNDRSELIEVLSLLKSSNPKSVFLNIDLADCYENSIDDQLSKAFNAFDSLTVLSKVRPFGTGQYRNIVMLCPLIHGDNIKAGFTNLIGNDSVANQIEKVQTKNIFLNRTEELFGFPNTQLISYHMAIKIAFALDFEKTTKFLKMNKDTVKIDFSKRREFKSYTANQLANNQKVKELISGKVIIIESRPYEFFIYRESETAGFKKMSTAEIFANVACQVIDR